MTTGPEHRHAHDSFTWPVVTLDFEASALSAGSYPIEAGICLWCTPEQPLEGWSTLICPTETWTAHGDWEEASAAVHGIPRAALSAGLDPTQTVACLNEITGRDGVAWCDGGAWDVHWARTLVRASGVRPVFAIGHWSSIAAGFKLFAYERMQRWFARKPSRHRARDDAERLMHGLVHGLGLEQRGSHELKLPRAVLAPLEN